MKASGAKPVARRSPKTGAGADASRKGELTVARATKRPGGILGGALQKIKEGRRASEERQKDIKKYRPQLEAWEKFCKQMGENPADVALAWLLTNPVVTAPIIGPRTADQLTGALRALKIKFTKAEMAKLDEIWPGPGGEAPEAYAW